MDKLHSLLRTVLLLALVLVVGWWTLFLRGKLQGSEQDLAERDQQIEALDERVAGLTGDLAQREARIASLGQEVAARDLRITELDEAVAERDRRIAFLGQELERSQAEVRRLEAAVALLKVDRRVARIEVLDQGRDDEGAAFTRVRFSELGADGAVLGTPLEALLAGTRVYLEALVIKFDDAYVEGDDFLRGTSVCLFQRIFGEDESPSTAARVEASGTLPAVYGGDRDPGPFYRELWERFWEYADDPEAAAAAGVRAVHGEAPFIEARPGRRYRVELRASGGLSITPE